MIKSPPLVKICGLTRVENALDCVTAGADMIGMVFFKKSPRNISIAQAQDICSALPGHVLACGVFVDETFDTLMDIATRCKLKGIQLHGSESPDLVEQLSWEGLTVIKAFFATRPPNLSMAKNYPAVNFCLAEYGKGVLPGGNAKTWDYRLTSGMDAPAPLMLAGGLTVENVGSAVSQIKPGAVDASSGVELSPGIKDIQKVNAFISAAKNQTR